MTLDPQVEFVLELVEKAKLPQFCDLSPQKARELFDSTAPKLDAKPRPVYFWEEIIIPGPANDIRIRLYISRKLEKGELLPVLVYFHGGGFVVGSLNSYDSLCRNLANRVDCIVASVDYRLAPEHKFPAATEDCYAALCWIVDNLKRFGGNRNKIATAGDSAGGNLAAVTSIRARNDGGPKLVHQLLIYPVIASEPETKSHHKFAEGFLLTRRNILWFYKNYLRTEEDVFDPRFSPILEKDLSNLPKTTIVLAGYDPLYDEGLAYSQRLKSDGNEVEVLDYNGMIHGFIAFSDVVDGADECLNRCATLLKHTFGNG